MENKEQKVESKEENKNKLVVNRQQEQAEANYVVKWLRNNIGLLEEQRKVQIPNIRVEENMEIGN